MQVRTTSKQTHSNIKERVSHACSLCCFDLGASRKHTLRVTVVVPVRWQEGLRCVILTASARGRLRVLGVDPCAEVRCTWITDGDCPGNLSLGQHTGDGKFDGETFLGRTWMFFLGGEGEGKRKRQGKYC